jgi:nucleoside-triphosphatase THEP1
MSCAFIIHGPIASGKTMMCLELVKRAQAEEVAIDGILSPRVFLDGKLMGYNCLDLKTGESFPLVRLRGEVDGPDWFLFGLLKYAFSVSGFERANKILKLSARAMDRLTLGFVDEFGRLENSRNGFYQGAKMVSEALSESGVALFTCRTDLVGAVEELVRGRASEVFIYEPGEVDKVWRLVRESLGSTEDLK